MVKKGIKKNIEKKILAFKDSVHNAGIIIDQLILFGSQAKGQAKPYSDIDIGVVSRQLGKDSFEEAIELRLLANKIDWRIEPHPLNPSDLKQRDNPLIHEILSTGVKIL